MSTNELVKAAAAEVLPPLGFRRRRPLWVLSLADGVHGFLGLNIGSGKGTVLVQSFIMVRHDEIEREFRARLGEVNDKDVPSILGHLSEVGVHDPPFLYVDEASAQEMMAHLADRLVRYGIPWMREMATLDGLARGLDIYDSRETFFRQPLAYRDLGRPDLALSVLDRDLAKFAHLDTPTVERFRRFAAGLRPELVAAGPADQRLGGDATQNLASDEPTTEAERI